MLRVPRAGHRSTLGLLALGSLLCSPGILAAQDARLAAVKRAADLIRASDIRRDVDYLASDANMGRRTPFPDQASPGYDSAAAYVARELKRLGVTPMGDNGTYFQHYTVTRSTLDTVATSARVGSQTLRWGDDFIVTHFLVPGVREGAVRYIGNGTFPVRPGVDPFAEFRGKWLLVNASSFGGRGGRGGGRGGPAGPTGQVGIDYITLNEIARHGGAAGIIVVPTEAHINGWNRRATTGQDLNPSVGVAYAAVPTPRILPSVAAFRAMLAGTSLSADALLRADSLQQYPAAIDLGTRVAVTFAATTLDARPYNVVGMVEGSDPQLKEEWISLAAHLDGAVPARAVMPGSVADPYNSADDNASGSAGNMAIVRALMAGPRPKRSILLIWDSGEEVGLWGTRSIAYGPWSEKLVLHVSNDMIGRSRQPNTPGQQNLSASDTIYATGPKLLSSHLQSLFERAQREFPYIAVDPVYENVASEFYYPRTDAGPYLERGIPILQFFNGTHQDYHQPGDDPGKLDIPKITNVSKLSYGALWLAADDPMTPRWDGILPHTLWWVTPKRR